MRFEARLIRGDGDPVWTTLELTINAKLHSDAARAGEWSASKDWCFWKTPLTELEGKTLGVVGFGRIGRRVGFPG